MSPLPGVVSWAEIDLGAIAQNVRALKQYIGPNVELIGVVKANAYGHGATEVSPIVLANGASRLAVHRLQEGIALRQAGIKAPILIMGYIPPSGAQAVVDWGLTPAVANMEFAQALVSYASLAGATVPVHIKVDTGLGRYGLMPDEAIPFWRALDSYPSLKVEGLFTHFATADSLEPKYVLEQLTIFKNVISNLREAGAQIPIIHAANSAAALNLPETHFNAVRCGITLYGLRPSLEWEPPLKVIPALTLKSVVARVRILPQGWAVGYGRTYICSRPTTVALVPIGYGDGYHRLIFNRGSVLIKGKRAPIIGRISMDQLTVDVSSIPGVKENDEVVLIGHQAEGEISAEEVASWAQTINYEVTSSLLPRVVRVYKQEGE